MVSNKLNLHVIYQFLEEKVPDQINEMISPDLTPDKDVFLSPYKKGPSENIESTIW